MQLLFPRFDYEWLADEVAKNLPVEMDFRAEAAYCEQTGLNFLHRPDVRVPEVCLFRVVCVA